MSSKVDNPVMQAAFDNGWSVSVAKVDDGDYIWNLMITNPDGHQIFTPIMSALEVFQEIASVQRIGEQEEVE